MTRKNESEEKIPSRRKTSRIDSWITSLENFDAVELYESWVKRLENQYYDWFYYIIEDEKQELQDKTHHTTFFLKRYMSPVFLFYSVIIILLATSLHSLIHELGHALVGIALGYELQRFVFWPFYFILSNADNAFVRLYPQIESETHYVLIYLGGPLTDLLFATFVLWCVFHFDFGTFLNAFCYIFFIYSAFSVTYYIINDYILFLQYLNDSELTYNGDWFRLFQMVPEMRFFILGVLIVWWIIIILLYLRRDFAQQIHFEYFTDNPNNSKTTI